MLITSKDLHLEINDAEFRVSAVRSRGPGGQNVNKVSSAAQLRWDYSKSPSLSDFQKRTIGIKLKNQINVRNEVFLRSDVFRDFPRNKEECLKKLAGLIELALRKQKARKKTKPTKASQKKRLESKRKKAQIKSSRSKVDY